MSAERDHTLQLYRALMDEAKIRIRWIEYAVNGKSGLDGPLVREFGFLQLRMLCELVALGCLAAHGDLPGAQKGRLPKSYSADEILNGLERLHADFFPVPLRETPNGPSERNFATREPDYMTKADLLTLYGRECGSALHRGSLKNLLKPGMPIQKNFPEIVRPAQRIANLLAFHRVEVLGGDTQIICMMESPADEGRVRISLAEAVPRDQLPAGYPDA